MRSIWRGSVAFGLVTIPVKLHVATEQRNVTFHTVHREDGGRVKFRRFCTVCEEEVPYVDVAKGYELPAGEMVVLDDDDFEGLPLSTSRRIEVLQFSPADQIDPILLNKSYYLEPDPVGVRPYVLLRDALERSGRVAIVKVALRQRESLAVLRIRDGVFVLETMLWPDEVRPVDFAFEEEGVDLRSQELRMTESLIETMVADFDPEQYRDAYREALQEVIEAKIAGKEIIHTGAPAEERPTADLMAALRASVEAAKKQAGSRAPARERASADHGERAGHDEEAVEQEKVPRKRKARHPA
ncbi:DNA end-binding protein Ku [Streptosporangium subroseum]|uniref:Non-homologous end joining protein Ku n=1 Tax=Streptosporangium subroseum TaxID=106412 RepID=A0A239NBV3_9ACTN|nr:Ku protein [Streptosporangium subroseum]SNT52396.1 DNA end-binding protein Ku [Streptosporangium subroseum]